MFFCDFWYYFNSHLSWKFHWNFSSCSEDMKIFSLNINYFHQFFGFFNISLLQRNRWRQYIIDYVSIFFTFNPLEIGWLTIASSYITIRLVLLEIYRGEGKIDILPQKKTLSKSPALSRWWKSKTRVTSYELRVQTYELPVQIHELPVQIHELED